MPRGIPNRPAQPAQDNTGLAPLESTLDEIRVLLEARRAEYQVSADRITEILTSLMPAKPRVGRPPAKKA